MRMLTNLTGSMESASSPPNSQTGLDTAASSDTASHPSHGHCSNPEGSKRTGSMSLSSSSAASSPCSFISAGSPVENTNDIDWKRPRDRNRDRGRDNAVDEHELVSCSFSRELFMAEGGSGPAVSSSAAERHGQERQQQQHRPPQQEPQHRHQHQQQAQDQDQEQYGQGQQLLASGHMDHHDSYCFPHHELSHYNHISHSHGWCDTDRDIPPQQLQQQQQHQQIQQEQPKQPKQPKQQRQGSQQALPLGLNQGQEAFVVQATTCLSMPCASGELRPPHGGVCISASASAGASAGLSIPCALDATRTCMCADRHSTSPPMSSSVSPPRRYRTVSTTSSPLDVFAALQSFDPSMSTSNASDSSSGESDNEGSNSYLKDVRGGSMDLVLLSRPLEQDSGAASSSSAKTFLTTPQESAFAPGAPSQSHTPYSHSSNLCQVVTGLRSMHQQQLFHHLALQQQQNVQRQQGQYQQPCTSESSLTAPLLSAKRSPPQHTKSGTADYPSSSTPNFSESQLKQPALLSGHGDQASSLGQSLLSSSSSSSASSSAFYSPSSSVTWASPSRATEKSPLSITRNSAIISDQHDHVNRKDKGKGVARGYRSSRRRVVKASFDGLPREVKIHIFRYLSTFQLVRVSRVSRAWRGLAMDGSLWKVIDTTRYYKTIHDDQLQSLGTAASAFLRYANFRGCAQLSGNSLRAIAEHCPNVEHLNLTGCRSVSSKSIADVCMNMPALLHLDLAGLQSVNNYTLQAMAVYCRSLQVLNLAWCKQISGAGLSKLTRSCQDLRKLNVSGCSGLEDRWMPVMGMNLPKLRELCLNSCTSLTDRGLIGLLSGLSLGSSKKHRKWRISRRMASSVTVSSLGHLLVNQSSCNDDDDEDDDDEGDEEEEEEEEEEDELDKEDEDSDHECNHSDANDVDGEVQSAVQPLSSLPQPSAHTQRRNEEELQAKLNYLGLSNCHQLTHESLRAIGHYCSRHLRRLELSGCESVGDEGLVMLAQNCTKLRLLDLEDVSLLTDVSLRAFGLHLQHLERISLSHCENVTDTGVMRMLRPAPNPTTLSTATAMMMNNTEGASSFCRKLIHIELDNCMLLTDRLLLEFANVLEERKAAAVERQRERERKRAERRERLMKRTRKAESIQGPPLSQHQQQKEQDPSPRSSYDQGSGVETEATATVVTPSDIAFISSSPVNIPDRLRRRHPAALSSGSLSFYSSSPLQPRSVLASTSVSEEVIAIKKTHRRARRGVLIPTRSDSSTSTTSNCSSSSTSLPLWSTTTPTTMAMMSSRRAVGSGKYSTLRARPKKILRPVMQVFDCRNITLEGVEAAQERCPTLAIKSYYSLTHPSTAAPASAMFGSGGAVDLGGLDDGDEDDEDDEDDDDDDSVSSGHGGRNGNSSQTSLHHLQMQHQHLQQQLQRRSRAAQLLHRARIGLLGRATGGGNRDSQCHIL